MARRAYIILALAVFALLVAGNASAFMSDKCKKCIEDYKTTIKDPAKACGPKIGLLRAGVVKKCKGSGADPICDSFEGAKGESTVGGGLQANTKAADTSKQTTRAEMMAILCPPTTGETPKADTAPAPPPPPPPPPAGEGAPPAEGGDAAAPPADGAAAPAEGDGGAPADAPADTPADPPAEEAPADPPAEEGR